MKKQITIKEIEDRLICLEEQLSYPQSMDVWKLMISEYNALRIKYCQMKGESPIVTYGQTDHII